MKASLYPAGNYFESDSLPKTISDSISNENGNIDLKAPLFFYDKNEEISALYTAFLKLSKQDFYEKEIEVKIGGNIWWVEMNLGVQYMIKVKDDHECNSYS